MSSLLRILNNPRYCSGGSRRLWNVARKNGSCSSSQILSMQSPLTKKMAQQGMLQSVNRCLGASTSIPTRSFTTESASHNTCNNDNCCCNIFGSSMYSTCPLFQFRSTNLGLVHRTGGFVSAEILDSIRQLPELETVLTSSETTQTCVTSLERAIDIFKQFQAGGAEHKAVLALLAESQFQRNSLADCLRTIQELQKHCGNDKKVLPTVALAQAKVYWLAGDTQSSTAICDALLKKESELDVAVVASARTGQAVSRLLAAQTLDDVFSVRDPFRMVVKQLERSKSSAQYTACLAAAHLNMGVAEVVYAEMIAKERKLELHKDVPLDGAMRSWKNGLTVLDRLSSKQKDAVLAPAVLAFLQTKLNANMAWGLLQMKDSTSTQEASEYAKKALAIYDMAENSTMKEGLSRTLTLVADCYHQSGGAVTAEGLLQSAIGKQQPKVPYHILDVRDAYESFASLCQNWEKREKNADKLRQQAAEIDKKLPPSWQGKSGIHSTLWFWTPSIVPN